MQRANPDPIGFGVYNLRHNATEKQVHSLALIEFKPDKNN
jgi:hypothetical protein